MNKKVLLIITLVSIISLGLITSTSVFAQNSTEGQNPMSSLVTKIAEKFSLKKEDVQAVFDAQRQERQQERQARYETKLSQDVTDGKITEAQKELILAKHKELDSNRQANFESIKNMILDERKTAMEKERTELTSWAKENNIDLKYLMGGFGHRGHGFGRLYASKFESSASQPPASQ